MAVSTYKHGVTWRDVPTSIVAPITADSGIPVAVGVASDYMIDPAERAPLNVPRIYYTYEEAVAEMGFNFSFHRYTLNEIIYNYFVLFNTGPIILLNVFDSDLGTNLSPPFPDIPFTLQNNTVDTAVPDVSLESVIVKSADKATTYVKDTDYALSYNNVTATLVITRITTGQIPADNSAISVTYQQVTAQNITSADIIGGVDLVTGKGTGLQAVDDVFPALAIVPGIILTPGWSQDPEVAMVTAAVSANINGCFKCTGYVDIDSEQVIKAQDVYAWKNSNNYVNNRLYACWPRVGFDGKDSWLSTQAAALTEWVDNSNDNVPVESPSNKNLKMIKTIAGPQDTPTDVFFGKSYADMLNGQGIATAINWIGGWRLWGNNLSIYPASSDPKDRWLPVRRMTDWVGNTIVLTIYQFVDKPGNRRLIDAVVDSLNIWLNSLVSAQNALGARVEFRHDENSDADLLNGHYTFHVYEAFPVPAEWIEFVLEFDVSYLDTLFNPQTTQTPITSATAGSVI